MKSKLPGFMELLKESWEQYKANWKSLIKVYVLGSVYALISILVTILLAALAYFALPQPYSFYLLGLIIIIGIVVTTYISFWFNLALGKATVEVGSGHKIESVRSVYNSIKPFVGAYFVMELLKTFIVFSGYIAFIVPGIILSIWFSFAVFTFLVDGKRGVSALILSRDYIKGNAWTVVFYFLGWGFITGVLFGMVPSYIFEELDAPALSGLLSLITSFIFTPMSILFMFNIYKSLKEMHKNTPKEYSEERKRKYYLLLILPVITVIGLVMLAINLFNSYDGGLPQLMDDLDTQDEWNVPTADETLS